MKKLFYLLILLTLGAGCSQNDCDCTPAGREVEFYLLQSYDLIPGTYATIRNAKIKSEPFITFSEIVSYDDSNYQFTLKKTAIDRIKPIMEPTAFAVTVNKEIIYTGFFRQSFLSSSCDCIRIDPQGYLFQENKIVVELGYASPNDLSSIDKRNAPILLTALAQAGKLR